MDEVKKAIESLKSINLNDGIDKLNIDKNDKVCLMICNPYFDDCDNELGKRVIEDGKLIEKIYLNKNYKVFNIVDASKEIFKDIYKKAMTIELEDFVVYYSGHGTNIPDDEGSEEDGQDECLVFKDGLITDDYLSSKFENCVCKEIFFIFDCCHSGTLADIEHLKQNNINLKVSSISGCADNECSVQLRNNGIFTYYINRYQNQPIKDIITKTNSFTSKYNQHLQIGGLRCCLCK